MKLTYEALKVLHHDVVVKKYKKLGLELPKDPKADGVREKIQDYVMKILAAKELREEEEVKRIFKLGQFYEQVQKEEKMYEAINVPE